MSNDSLTLYGVQNYGDVQNSQQLESSLLGFFQWSFLNIGAFSNVTIPQSGWFGGNQHQLRMVSDPYLTDGQAWEGFRQDWVWESGVMPWQPIRVSGCYVNGNFQPVSGIGPYSHHVEYPRGRIVFDNPIPTNSTVTAEYSYRSVHFVSSDVPWFQQLQFDSLRIDDPHFQQQGSGNWNVLSDNRVQLPAVVVEVTPEINLSPLEIGTKTRKQLQTVNFHVLSETPWEKKSLTDILVNQWQTTIFGFDRNILNASGGYPLDVNGSLVPSGMMYPDLVSPSGGYRWRRLWLKDCRSYEVEPRPPLYQSQVTMGIEIYLP